MVTCFTGAVLVYEKELMQLFHKERYYTKHTGNRLSADELIKAVKAKDSTVKIGSVRVYADATRNVEITVTKPERSKKEEKVKGKKEEAKGTRLVAFVDPYNAEVIEFYNHRKSFFYFMMDLHRWMLGGDIGKLIVGISTIIFLFILITGIILWWPRNKAILKQRLKIKMGAGFKRLNHDYHIVLGFYSAIFLFVFAFTGLAWSFEWFNKGIYTVTGSSMEKPKNPLSTIKDSSVKISVETALSAVIDTNKNAVYYNLTLPKDSADAFSVSLLDKNAPHETASDTYFVDAFSGKVIGRQLFSERNIGQKTRSTFRPVHVASVYGHTSKLIGFLACLLGTFFPASGIIMWINRTRKKSKKKYIPVSDSSLN